MKFIMKISMVAAIIIICTSITMKTSETAQAAFFDRAKDIYHIPDQFDVLQQEYGKAKQMMEAELAEQRELMEQQLEAQREQLEGQLSTQQEQLEQSRNQTEELLRNQEELQQSNEYYRQQNEEYRQQANMLMAENQNLLLKIEQIEQDRKSFYYKLTTAIGTIIGLLLLYTLSVRIWRFFVWRKQRNSRSVFMS